MFRVYNPKLRSYIATRVLMSTSAPSTQTSSSSSKTPKPIKSDVKPKRESIRSYLASIFGGYIEAADPNQKPFRSDEVMLPDLVEKATGEEKLFLLAFENGILDPYCNMPVEVGNAGTKDNPVLIESFSDDRIIACVCEPSKNSHCYMIAYKGEPKRCNCGHWVKLIDAPKFWEQLPKEDLINVKLPTGGH